MAMAGVDEVVEDARVITQTGDRDAAGTGETSRPNDADARARITDRSFKFSTKRRGYKQVNPRREHTRAL